MSLSKQNVPDIQPQLQVTGRVIVGGIKNNTATERTLTELMTSREKRPIWTPDEEMAFIDRVTQKAREKAKIILAEALAEAGRLRVQAREQGYAEGRAQGYEEGYQQGYAEAQQLAEQQLAAAHQEMADSLAQALVSQKVGDRRIGRQHPVAASVEAIQIALDARPQPIEAVVGKIGLEPRVQAGDDRKTHASTPAAGLGAQEVGRRKVDEGRLEAGQILPQRAG